MKFVAGENGEKHRERSTHTSIRPPRNTHGVTEVRTRDPSIGGSPGNISEEPVT